jgi:hypothetical protein
MMNMGVHSFELFEDEAEAGVPTLDDDVRQDHLAEQVGRVTEQRVPVEVLLR